MAKRAKALRGHFTPQHPEKWIINEKSLGRGHIEYRSSWEKRFCVYADLHSSIIKVSSEPFAIPYLSPLDNKVHRYYIDFYVEMIKKDGTTEEVLIEVKPHAETKKPRQNKKNPTAYRRAVETFLRNSAKWDAARAFCEKNGLRFLIMTEFELGLKTKKVRQACT